MRVIEAPTETFFLRSIFLLCLLLLLPVGSRAERLPIKTYTIAEGLARDTVNRIIQDPQGFLWFCTTEGLSRFDGYKFTTYRTDQGLPHFIVNDLLRTRSGLYWVATGSGVSLFNPVVASSEVGGAHVDAQANVLRCVEVWDAPGGFDGSEFERMSREYTFAPGAGLPGRVWASGQPLWINDIATDDNFLRLSTDTEGEIQSAFGFPILLGGEVYGIIEFFSLETHEPDKELLETMSTIGSQIGQLIERRRAEEALQLTREERLAELERVRKRIATDLHDDIGSSLTQISILSEVTRQQVGPDNSPITKPLKMIATASRELVDTMSDIVWAINPQKDHLSDLQQRMRRFAADVFTARNIEFRFRSPDHETDIQLGANLRREVFLIFKESIDNMVKHSG